MDPVRQHAAGCDLLRACDHDAVVALLHHAGIERGIALLVRRFRAVDLRRDDGVAEIEVLVAHALIERDHVVGELLTAGRKHARHRRIAGEESGHMIGRAPHQAEAGLGPFLREQPPRLEVGVRARDLVGAQHRLAGLGRGERHQLAVLKRRGDVVEPRHRARRFAERGMGGDVLDPLAVDKHRPAVIQ